MMPFPSRSTVAAFVKDKMRMTTLMMLIVTLAGYLAGLHRIFELLCHFRVQYLAASVLLCVLLLLFRDWRWGSLGLVCVALNAVPVIPWYFGRPEQQRHPAADDLRVLLSNVFTKNLNSAAIIELARRETPDVLVLQEVDERWMDELFVLGSLLPHSKVIPRNDNFGIGIWSHLPFHGLKQVDFGVYGVPSIGAQVEVADQRIMILATHPVPPVTAGGFAERNKQLSDLALFVRQSAAPTIIVGDLNVTMWSPYHAKLIRESGLKNARKGFGVLATWPTFMPIMKIPLDQCLVSPSLQVAGFRTGDSVGSDHLPIIVDLIIPPKQ
jgi:endonuclease/exonuclease/phosphatase (EEP) superfamily protein YafD